MVVCATIRWWTRLLHRPVYRPLPFWRRLGRRRVHESTQRSRDRRNALRPHQRRYLHVAHDRPCIGINHRPLASRGPLVHVVHDLSHLGSAFVWCVHSSLFCLYVLGILLVRRFKGPKGLQGCLRRLRRVSFFTHVLRPTGRNLHRFRNIDSDRVPRTCDHRPVGLLSCRLPPTSPRMGERTGLLEKSPRTGELEIRHVRSCSWSRRKRCCASDDKPGYRHKAKNRILRLQDETHRLGQQRRQCVNSENPVRVQSGTRRVHPTTLWWIRCVPTFSGQRISLINI